MDIFIPSANYNTSTRTGRAIYWSNYKIMNPSGNPLNLPEMTKLTHQEVREGELPLISISERALATKVSKHIQVFYFNS